MFVLWCTVTTKEPVRIIKTNEVRKKYKDFREGKENRKKFPVGARFSLLVQI